MARKVSGYGKVRDDVVQVLEGPKPGFVYLVTGKPFDPDEDDEDETDDDEVTENHSNIPVLHTPSTQPDEPLRKKKKKKKVIDENGDVLETTDEEASDGGRKGKKGSKGAPDRAGRKGPMGESNGQVSGDASAMNSRGKNAVDTAADDDDDDWEAPTISQLLRQKERDRRGPVLPLPVWER
jgi:hypothetical protein